MNPESKITLIGTAVNLLLAGLKFAVGILGGSMALVADGVHSISDLLTDAVVLVGARVAALPADENHPYGHGKFETLAALLVALVLVATGGLIAYQSGLSLYNRELSSPGLAVLFVAFISIVSKELLFRATRKTARKTHSPALLANAWHHRSDALSSVAVLLGVGAAMLGFGYGDHVAGILVGLMVTVAGGKIALDCLGDLTECSIEDKQRRTIEECLTKHSEVKNWHRLRARRVGREIFLDVHILVDPGLSVSQGHAVADELEEAVSDSSSNPVNFTIHVEPYDERKA